MSLHLGEQSGHEFNILQLRALRKQKVRIHDSSERVKMTSNESIVFRISEANGVIFYLGSKRLVRVHIKKAVQGH